MLHLILSIFIGFLITSIASEFANETGITILTFILLAVAFYGVGSGILNIFNF